MSDETAAAQATESTSNDAPPAWFAAYVDAQKKDREALSKDLDKRFEGFRKKYVEPGDAGEGDDAGGKPKKKLISEDEIDARVAAGMELGAVRAKLADEARAEIDDIARDEGVHAALRIAQFYARHASVEPAVERSAPIKGKGASPASNKAQLPTTQVEYIELRRRDRAKADELRRQHPEFDPEKLPQR